MSAVTEALVAEVTERLMEADPEEDDKEGLRKEVRQVLVAAEEVKRHRQQCAGDSLLDLLWRELMFKYGQLMDPAGFETDGDYRAAGGEALGIAKAISIILNPYRPDVDAVRAEAAGRYESQ